MSEVQHGLEGVIAFETEIAEPDRAGGALRYRGVDIEDLVGRYPYGRAVEVGELGSVMKVIAVETCARREPSSAATRSVATLRSRR